MKALFLIQLLIVVGCTQQFVSAPLISGNTEPMNRFWDGYKRLSGAEIKQVFGDVLDQAKVVDGAGGSAINNWYKNGRFTSSWESAERSGQLSGNWFVQNDMRCVTLDSEVGDLKANQQRCAPIYSKDGKYYSVNKSGGVHGVHLVTGIPTSNPGAEIRD